MWVTSHSLGVTPVLPQDVPPPPATDCRQILLVGEVFLQPEEGPCGRREQTAAPLNLAQPQLFGVMVGEDLLPPQCHFSELECWGKEHLESRLGLCCSETLLPALWWWVGMGVNAIR